MGVAVAMVLMALLMGISMGSAGEDVDDVQSDLSDDLTDATKDLQDISDDQGGSGGQDGNAPTRASNGSSDGQGGAPGGNGSGGDQGVDHGGGNTVDIRPGPSCPPVYGTEQADFLKGDPECNDDLWGQAGADLLVGRDGHDLLVGDDGEDSIFGGAGNDELRAGGSAATGGGAGNILNLGDFLVDVEGSDRFEGGAQGDVIIASAPSNVIDFMAAQGSVDDDAMADGGWLSPDGTIKTDLWNHIHGQGSTPANWAVGSDQDAADIILAAGGNDIIMAGSGDQVSGGAGEDIYLAGDWIEPAHPMVIKDFQTSGMPGSDGDDLLVMFTSGGQVGEAYPLQLTYVPTADGPGDVHVFMRGVHLVTLENVGDVAGQIISQVVYSGQSQAA